MSEVRKKDAKDNCAARQKFKKFGMINLNHSIFVNKNLFRFVFLPSNKFTTCGCSHLIPCFLIFHLRVMKFVFAS